ncbi:uncharacterized protein [Clytia hemisphaerica]|uniref:Potassium channel domain-containing protein n=1 Tax=Clytia hemisphaerica TaxID=252671 RepID=A0A7M5TX87_9CNID
MRSFFTILIFQTLVYKCSAEALYKAIYWDVKPWVITDEKSGNKTGIIPDLVSRSRFFCGTMDGYKELIEYSKNFTSANDMFQLFLSGTPYGQGELANFTSKNAIWIPYLKILDDADIEKLYERNSTYFVIDRIREMVVIESEWKISLQYKFLIGLYECHMVFIYVFLFTTTYSVVVWLLERNVNENVSRSFFKGFLDAFWMNNVTFVTVGYGDIYPRHIGTKILMIGWMFFGLFYASMMTALVMAIVEGDGSDLLSYQKTIAVMDNSFEKTYIERNYDVNIIPTRTYYESIDKVRSGEVDAAIMNSQTAAWYKEDILTTNHDNPVKFVGKIKIDIPMLVVFPKPSDDIVQKTWLCVKEYWEEIVEYAFHKYTKVAEINTHQVNDVIYSFKYTPIKVALTLTVMTILAGFAFDQWSKRKSVRIAQVDSNGATKEDAKMNNNEQAVVTFYNK